MPSARSRLAVVVVAWAAGAAALALASGTTWTQVPATQFAPAEALGGPAAARALGVAALAAAGALPLVRTGGRRVLGVLGVLLGAGAAGVVVLAWPGRSPGVEATGTGYAVVALLGAALVAVGGGVAAVRAGTWPQPGRRFARGAGDPAPGAVPPDTPAGAREAWDALDRGEDPTDRA